jgi:hypothetical protein
MHQIRNTVCSVLYLYGKISTMLQPAMILGMHQKVAAFSFYGELNTKAAYFQGIRYNAESIQVKCSYI